MSFISVVAHLTDLDKDKVASGFEKLNIDSIMELINAVNANNKNKALFILSNTNENTIFKKDDRVNVLGEEGMVRIPNGPHNTIGVVIDGQLTMVNREDVSLNETIVALPSVPTMQRMRELAGIEGFDKSAPVEVARIQTVGKSSLQGKTIASLQTVNGLLDSADEMITHLQANDREIVRRRLNQMVESVDKREL